MVFGIQTGGLVSKIMGGTVLGIGLTLGWLATNWAWNTASNIIGTRAYYSSGYNGNVIPYEQTQQYNYDSNNPAMYGPSDEQRFVG